MEAQRIPLEPCESWDAAAELARDALAFILNDPTEAGGTRVKAAELMLLYAMGKPGGEKAEEPRGLFEEWLAEVQKKGLSSRL
jgi:hypothetical protein